MNPMLEFVVLAGLLFGGMALSEAGPSCGQLKSDSIGPITLGSNVTHAGNFPWTVLVHSPVGRVSISGALIHPNVVLTAARSLEGLIPVDLIAYADSETRNIEQIIYRGSLKADFSSNFALLKLSSPFTDVSTVCIPRENTKLDEENCFVTELGDYTLNEQSSGKVQLQIEAQVVERSACQTIKQKDDSNYKLPDDVMCGEQRSWPDKCDSKIGGVLYCPLAEDKNTFMAVGVSSHVRRCGSEFRLSLFGKVRTVRKLIDKKLKNLGFTNSSYDAGQ